MLSEHSDPSERRPRPMRMAMIIAGLAFLAGLGLMAWTLTQWEPGRKLAQGDVTTVTDLVSAQSPSTSKATDPLSQTPDNALVAQPDMAERAAPATVLPDQNRLADVESRMARIDLRAAAAASNASRAEGLLIAFAARRAIDRGVPLGYIEGELRNRFGSSQPRAVGAIIAATQTPTTLAMLSGNLERLRPDLAASGVNEGWWAATKRTLGGLIVVRREGDGSPAPDQRFERAVMHLRSGDVENAMAEVSRMPGSEAATSWLSEARRYVDAHRALDIIEAATITENPVPTPAIAPALSPANSL